ncbi:MAG: SixA phosphatase family protein [Bacteroidota bacterium]
MKTLYVVRHAKSSWDNPEQADFNRPLNERGKRDAPRMGKRLKEKGIKPDVMMSSPAKRAWSTCKKIAEVIGFPEDKIKSERSLYHASEDDILSVVRNIKDKHDSLMIFGHNPGLTDFVNELMDEETLVDIGNIPTCGIAAFTFDVESWNEVNWEKGKLIFYDYPKSKED